MKNMYKNLWGEVKKKKPWWNSYRQKLTLSDRPSTVGSILHVDSFSFIPSSHRTLQFSTFLVCFVFCGLPPRTFFLNFPMVRHAIGKTLPLSSRLMFSEGSHVRIDSHEWTLNLPQNMIFQINSETTLARRWCNTWERWLLWTAYCLLLFEPLVKKATLVFVDQQKKID